MGLSDTSTPAEQAVLGPENAQNVQFGDRERNATAVLGPENAQNVQFGDRERGGWGTLRGGGKVGATVGSMALDPQHLSDEVQAFLAEKHLATLTTVRPDGSPHVVPVGFHWDPSAGLVRIITFASSTKVRNIAAGNPRAAVSQVDHGRWITLEGSARVSNDPADVAKAVEGYASRYRQPSERSDRVAIEIVVDRVLGRA